MEDATNADVSSAAPPPAPQPSSPNVEPTRRDHNEGRLPPFLPMLLLVVGALAWPAFQCYQLVNEKQTIATIYSNQNRQFEDSGKLRNALDGLARDTALLATNGNASAKLVVDELARRGVTIDPTKPPSAPPKAAN